MSVLRALRSSEHRPGLPSSLQRGFEERCSALKSRSLALSLELERVLRALRADGVQAMPYKGPVWVERLYGDISAREYLDLDVLVRGGQERAARSCLERLGFRFRWDLTPAREKAVLSSQCHFQMEGPAEGVWVELHWGAAPAYFPVRIDVDAVFSRSSPATFGSTEVGLPSPEDMVALLVVHGTKDLWQRLSWVCDLARAIEIHQDRIDWTGLLDRARAEGWERMLLLGAGLCERLLGCPLPEAVDRRLQQRDGLDELARSSLRQMFGQENHRYGVWPPAAYHLRSLDGAARKLRYAAGYAAVLATPTALEWERWPLPDRWFFLYYPLRAARLAARSLSARKIGGR